MIIFLNENLVVNPCVCPLKGCQPNVIHHTQGVKVEKLQYLIRFWWHIVLNLQEMNRMACSAHGNYCII